MNVLRIIFLATILLLLEQSGILSGAQAAYPPISTDPMRVKQKYLDQIHVNEAWATTGDSPGRVVVAVVDTGVDMTHPDLAGSLIEGVNLLQPGSRPIDDNGHGTNVAGIIAAALNNDIGIAGIAPNVQIMPIKALEMDGTGGEAKLGEGIRYAVDHGAHIVVLSLGLNKYSEYLSRIVEYAESKGVLLVAAAGNEGTSVKYPAAYPTVLAVGGVAADKRADYRSNFGPELDLVAPWDVYTTALGGGYEYKDGSSMSAPQVAAAAALVWGKYPDLQAYEVRSLLQQTAEDLSTKGWDATTGYGLLRIDQALTQPYKEDRFEPNNRKEQAAKIPVQSLIHASLSSAQDQDWFAIEVPYSGQLEISLSNEETAGVTVRTGQGAVYTTNGSTAISLQAAKGTTYIQMQTADRSRKAALRYALSVQFHIYEDPFEDNDRQYKAFALPGRTQSLKGTFHEADDQDWFVLMLEQSGTLRLKCSVDTARIDPALLLQRKGEKSITVDQSGDGVLEASSLIEVLPGEYYIRVTNVKDYEEAIMGEYTLDIDFTPKWIDPNEPNDKSFQATYAGLFSEYKGVFHDSQDVDWFEFRIGKDSLTQISLDGIPQDRTLFATLYDNSLQVKGSYQNGWGQDALFKEVRLTEGTYFLKLQTSQWFIHQMYRLQIGAYPIVNGYIDVEGHWARSAILELSRKQIVSGYGNYRFAPNKSITRAEAATLLVKAFSLSQQKKLSYTDLPTSHWAYNYIAAAEQAGLVEGYPNNRFGPDRKLTRMEMTQLLARAMGVTGTKKGKLPFSDISEAYWGSAILKEMYSDGWVSGYADGTFRPEKEATRAEFAALLSKVLNR